MQRQAVKSSNIQSVGYDEDEKVLEIAFKSGTVYRYYNVSKRVHTALMKAESKGQYFNVHVKGIYEFRKVD